MVQIKIREGFSAAHFLPMVGHGHKCGNIHGHSYKVEVTFMGDLNPAMGWVEDFAVMRSEIRRIIRDLDHRHLNQLLENPTAENLALFIAEALRSGIHRDSIVPYSAVGVELWEEDGVSVKVGV